MIRIYYDNQNILVQFEFGFGSLNIKILNLFKYLTNFSSNFVLFFGSVSIRFFQIPNICPSYMWIQTRTIKNCL